MRLFESRRELLKRIGWTTLSCGLAYNAYSCLSPGALRKPKRVQVGRYSFDEVSGFSCLTLIRTLKSEGLLPFFRDSDGNATVIMGCVSSDESQLAVVGEHGPSLRSIGEIESACGGKCGLARSLFSAQVSLSNPLIFIDYGLEERKNVVEIRNNLNESIVLSPLQLSCSCLSVAGIQGNLSLKRDETFKFEVTMETPKGKWNKQEIGVFFRTTASSFAQKISIPVFGLMTSSE